MWSLQGVNNGATVYAIPTSQAYAVRGQLSPASAAVVLSPGSGLQSSPIGSEDAARKREMRLLKNRLVNILISDQISNEIKRKQLVSYGFGRLSFLTFLSRSRV